MEKTFANHISNEELISKQNKEFTQPNIYICIYIYEICIYNTYITYKYTFTCIFICMYAYKYICIHVCIYVFTYLSAGFLCLPQE